MLELNFNNILDVFIDKLIPETKIAVEKGNKIFGAFIINKLDLNLVVTGTNNEIVNPLYHGEISTIFNFFKLNSLNPKNYYFISSHEPCTLCLSAITWSGFDNFYYFFPYEETESNFNIPHDLNIFKEVFNIHRGEYNKKNHYWESHSIIKKIKEIATEDNSILFKKIHEIQLKYQELSDKYQETKISNNIPLK